MTTHNSAYGESHGTLKYYIIGFILSIILTIIPYVIVTQSLLPHKLAVISVVFAGILQLIVQIVFFLHLGAEEKPRLNLMSFIFTLCIVLILFIGTLWIMYNLDVNMLEYQHNQQINGQVNN